MRKLEGQRQLELCKGRSRYEEGNMSGNQSYSWLPKSSKGSVVQVGNLKSSFCLCGSIS